MPIADMHTACFRQTDVRDKEHKGMRQSLFQFYHRYAVLALAVYAVAEGLDGGVRLQVALYALSELACALAVYDSDDARTHHDGIVDEDIRFKYALIHRIAPEIELEGAASFLLACDLCTAD